MKKRSPVSRQLVQLFSLTLTSSLLVVEPAMAGVQPQIGEAAATAAAKRRHERAAVRGELALQKCVAVSKQKLSEADRLVIRSGWRLLGGALRDGASAGVYESLFESASNHIKDLSPAGRERGDLLLQWMRLQYLLERLMPLKISPLGSRESGGLSSLVIRVLRDEPLQDARAIGRQTTAVMKLIQDVKADGDPAKSLKVSALSVLAQLEDSLAREALRVSRVSEADTAEFYAQARPVFFALAGSAMFAGAVILAEPILATGVALANSSGLSAAVGQIGGTGLVALVGASGIDIINQIAIPLWIEAYKDSIRRNISVSCAMEKQVEIGKELELEKIADSMVFGAGVGVTVSGVTILTPAILRYLGGRAIYSGWSKSAKSVLLVGAGRTARIMASYVDEVALFTVVGLVGIGAAFEGYEAYHNAHAAFLTFNGILEQTESKAREAHAARKERLAGQYEDLARQIRAIKAGYMGDASRHLVDLAVCGYLLTHMAHGEFVIALEGELEEVIEALATSSDDAPTGIGGANSAVNSFMGVEGASPVDVKLYMLQAKLNMIERSAVNDPTGETISSLKAFDQFLDLPDHELRERAAEAMSHLSKAH